MAQLALGGSDLGLVVVSGRVSAESGETALRFVRQVLEDRRELSCTLKNRPHLDGERVDVAGLIGAQDGDPVQSCLVQQLTDKEVMPCSWVLSESG